MSNTDRILINGKEQDVKVIGSDQYYKSVRNLVLLAGRFMDRSDVDMRGRVALLTEKLAVRLYGGQSNAIGRTLKIYRVALHCDRHVQGEGRELWTVGGEQGNDSDSDYRIALFFRDRAHRPSVCPGEDAANRGIRHPGGTPGSGEPSPGRAPATPWRTWRRS